MFAAIDAPDCSGAEPPEAITGARGGGCRPSHEVFDQQASTVLMYIMPPFDECLQKRKDLLYVVANKPDELFEQSLKPV